MNHKILKSLMEFNKSGENSIVNILMLLASSFTSALSLHLFVRKISSLAG